MTAPTTSQHPPVTLHRVLSVRTRPKRPGPLAASLTHFWRAMRTFQHFPAQLIDIVVFPFIFLVVFTYLFGGAISGSTGDYLQNFVPGILVQTVVMMSVYTGTSLNGDITKGIHDRFRTLPFWQPATLVGNLLGDAVRYTIALTITLLLGLALGFRPDGVPGVLVAFLLMMFFAFAVSWIFTAMGVVASRPETVSTTSMMVMFPLVFASNIFVPTDSLPGWMEAFVKVNPISHVTTASRGLMHGNADAGDIALTLATSGALIAVSAPLAVYMYANKNKH
ncbi:ABC transporter permease [Actinomadura kijaniata]|uniref:ABC transporter permease n=1 Tax=Actinomadura kijaniata TaxID=46161 RepID=UPI000A549954|nr:ABC transporter permease [Actinomadura kijaniata]